MTLELAHTSTPAQRTPPASIEAEKACLGAVLIKPATLDDLADLAIDDFALPVHREILEAMRVIALRGRPIDAIAIADELKSRGQLARLEGGIGYLLELAGAVPTAENVRHYARLVSEKATLRRVIATCAEAMSVSYSGEDEADEVIAELRARIGALEVRGKGGPVRIGADVDRVVDDMEQRGLAPEKHLVPSGIEAFDERIGGLRSDKLVVVAANPGRGKTALAWNTAVRAARRGIPVLVFSLEMSRAELIERGLAMEARVNSFCVSRGRLSQAEWAKVDAAKERLRPIPLWVEGRKLSAQRICSEARRWRAQQRAAIARAAVAPDANVETRALIVIDYLGLVRNEREGDNRAREVGEMSRLFKLLAGEDQADAPVILCAQLNRDNMKTGKDGKPRRPIPSDLRDSGEIEQDADLIIFPWWEGDPPLYGRHPAELLVAKHRGGPKADVPVDWEPEFTTFSDRLDEHHEPEQQQMPL